MLLMIIKKKPEQNFIRHKSANCVVKVKQVQKKESNNNEYFTSTETEDNISSLSGEMTLRFFEPRMGLTLVMSKFIQTQIQ